MDGRNIMYFIEMQPYNKNHRTTQRYHLRRPIKEIPPCGRNDGAGWDIGKGREKWRPSLVSQLSTYQQIEISNIFFNQHIKHSHHIERHIEQSKRLFTHNRGYIVYR